MKITKFGHSCLFVEQGEARILIDPGAWSEGHTNLTNLDAILITHEHQDHCDIASLQILKKQNPNAIILTNSDVGKKLSGVGIEFEVFEGGSTHEIHGLYVEAVGRDHAIIYGKSPCQNTGYFVGGRLYHPGDSFHLPDRPIELLALPVCAPWLKTNEVIDFAIAIQPKTAFPIHDGMLKHVGAFHKRPQMMLEEREVQWQVLEPGVPTDF